MSLALSAAAHRWKRSISVPKLPWHLLLWNGKWGNPENSLLMPVYCVYKIISLCPLCAFLPTQKEIVLAEASICLCAALDPPTKCGTGYGLWCPQWWYKLCGKCPHRHRDTRSTVELQTKACEDFTRRRHSILNVKALAGAFNQEKALVGAFSVIVKCPHRHRDSRSTVSPCVRCPALPGPQPERGWPRSRAARTRHAAAVSALIAAPPRPLLAAPHKSLRRDTDSEKLP